MNSRPATSSSPRRPVTAFGNTGRYRRRPTCAIIAIGSFVVCFFAFYIFGGAKLEAGNLRIPGDVAKELQGDNIVSYTHGIDSYRLAKPYEFDEDGLKGLLTRYTSFYHVELSLVMALMKVESDFDPEATSPVGARGLMQLMPDTARDLGLVVNGVVDERLQPAKNIETGIRYLRTLLDMFNNPLDAVAAYNVGPGVVQKGLPSNTETLQHVYKVMRQKHMYDRNVDLMDCDMDLCYENLKPAKYHKTLLANKT